MKSASTLGTVVVTGASAGVGRAIARRFGRDGVRVGLIARDQAALDELAGEIAADGGRAVPVAADVADASAVSTAADTIARELGPIELWINNAMVTVFSPLWEMTPEEFRRVTEVTYLGCVHGTMAALDHMRPRQRGAIIQIGSALAYRGIPLQSAYCGAKHAIRGFTDSVRAELLAEHSPITLTMLQLPAVNTPQFDWARTHMPRQPRPVPPVVQPEVIADAVFSAAQHPRREYWIGTSSIEFILGNFLIPGFFDWYLGRTVEGQQTEEPVMRNRPDNLEHPIDNLHRSRGRFGDEARSRAVVLSGPAIRLASVLTAGAVLIALGAIAGRTLAPVGASATNDRIEL